MVNRWRSSSSLIAAALLLLGGCRTISKRVTESVLEHAESEQWSVRYGSQMRYTLTAETLADVEFEGSVQAGETTVRYQRGLADQAQCIAELTASLLEQVQERTGVALSTRGTVYLLRLDQWPQNFDITLAVEPDEFPLPMFVQVDEESCEAILARNRSYPYLFVHEVVETSLASRAGTRVLPDLTWGAMGLNVHLNNYTRWFRDGLANYAGYIAYELVSAQTPRELRLRHRQTLVHSRPFSSLAQIGDRLFSWPQSSRTAHERDYYNAALGLFLLIADRFGEEAIREIVEQAAERKAVDGRDLVAIADAVLATDVKRLAEAFTFFEIGAELERMSPALARNAGVALHEGIFVKAVKDGGAAARAGLQEKDIITAVGGTRVENDLDFELGLFRERAHPSVSLTVERLEGGTFQTDLPLAPPEDPGAPGKRRNPLKKGRLEFTHLLLSSAL